jgi:CheY-like chemotaxis protein
MKCKNVLLIEDDQAIRRTMKDVLEIQGFKVFLAADGKEGTEQLQAIAPEPCVILLDLMMPVMNGWQFLDFQRNDPKFRNIPVVICSAYAECAKAVNPSAFVPKPVQFNALLGAVKAFCE